MSRSSRPRPEYVTLAAAAEYADCSIKTIRRRIADGTLTAQRLRNSHLIRIDLNEIDSRLLRPIPAGGGAR